MQRIRITSMPFNFFFFKYKHFFIENSELTGIDRLSEGLRSCSWWLSIRNRGFFALCLFSLFLLRFSGFYGSNWRETRKVSCLVMREFREAWEWVLWESCRESHGKEQENLVGVTLGKFPELLCVEIRDYESLHF